MALKQNLGVHVSDPNKLKRIAERLGYRQTRGPDKGEGSVRQLLEAIIAGELTITPKRKQGAAAATPSDQREAILNKLAERGVIARRTAPRGRLEPFTPIRIEGEPVSEMIIRERR